MKKIIASILAVGISVSCIVSAGAADINMCVKDNYITRDLQTLGSVDMVPILDIAGELGLNTYFDGYTLWVEYAGKAYKLTLGSADVYDGHGKWYGLDVTLRYINNKLYVASGFLSDIMGISYTWDGITRVLYVGSDRTLNWIKTNQEYKDAVNCRRAYADYLNERKHILGYSAKFDLAYIDNNDVPELLVAEDNDEYTSVRVLTYKNDNIVDLDDMGGGGEVGYIEKSGRVYGYFTDNDYDGTEYQFVVLCELKDISLEYVHNVGINVDTGETLVDGNYESEWYWEYIYDKCEFEKMDYCIWGPTKALTTENINNYLLKY